MLRSLIRRSIDGGTAYRVPAAELLDSVLPNIGDVRAKSTAFWALLVCSSIIAAAGVLAESTAVIIGAMVIAPLGTPIYGVAAALVSGTRSGPALLRVVGGVLVAVAIGMAVDFVTIERVAVEANSQILSRTSPSLIDLMVAFATGVAGSMALVRLDIAPALPGVAIAISLVPPLTVVGITLAHGEFGMALGAMLLFTTNMLAIVLAGLWVFSSAGIEAPFGDRIAPAPHARTLLIAASVFVVIALASGTAHAVYLLNEESQVRDVAQQTANDTPNWDLQSVSRQGDQIEVVFVAEPGVASPPPLSGKKYQSELRAVTSDVVVHFETGTRITP